MSRRLDVYGQAIYSYLFRHTRLLGLEEAVIGFKSVALTFCETRREDQ
jgi:hypothetical protein